MDPLFLLLHYLIKAGKEVSFPQGVFEVGEGRRHSFSVSRCASVLRIGAPQVPVRSEYPPSLENQHWMVIKSDPVTVASEA